MGSIFRFSFILLALLSTRGAGKSMAQDRPGERVYQAFISDQMHNWDRVITEMSMRKESLSDAQLGELVNYYYGYTGWLIDVGPKKKANEYVEAADAIIDELMAKYPNESTWYAFKGAFYGFKIGLNLIKAPFLGPESMNNIEHAIEIGPRNPQGWIEMGNAYFYMPKAFGGSKEKATEAFDKAIKLMEEKPETLIHNWIYLNVLMVLGQSYEKTGNLDMAKSTYDKLLEFEPDFSYVRDELYPAFLNSYHAAR